MNSVYNDEHAEDEKQKELEQLWKQYSKTGDLKIKEKLIIAYAPLVKYVAGRLSIYLCNNVEYADLMSYGVFGLMDAINKFDITKEVKFETYASLRIRGAILDQIRKMDWVPRTLRQKHKELENVYKELESTLGRSATDAEVAEKLNISQDELQELFKKTNICSLISLEEYTEQNYESNIGDFSQKQSDQPEKQLEQKEAKEILKEALDSLAEREKKIIILYYFEELTLKEISSILGVSESRISQIHSKSLVKLKTKLGKYQSLLLDI